ncbi:MAG: Flp pilus assembly protein CpaB [Myxococcota bacterium]
MNKKALIAAAIAALLGLGMLWLYMKRFEAEASGGPPVSVLMATQDIPLGTILTADMLGVREVPSSYLEERHIRASDAQRIIGIRVSMGVRANESVLWTDLSTTAQQRRDLSGLVRNGMRAITIRADVTSAFGGLLRPGNRVDVLLTATRGPNDYVTLPLLQNVLVLAVGRDTGSRGNSEREEDQFEEITLSVTVEQAQILTFSGRAVGRLTLILRNDEDLAILEELPETDRNDILEEQVRRRLWRREPEAAPTVMMPTPLGGGR